MNQSGISNKKTLIKLFFIIFPTCVVLVLLELAARVYIKTTANNIDKNVLLYYKGATIGLPSLPNKPPQELRIFAYGASTTEGTHLTKASYPKQLEVLLNNSIQEKIAKVYNFGFSAFTSTDDRYLVERTIRDNPDAIIIYTSHNEFLHGAPVPYGINILQGTSGLAFPKVAAFFIQKLVHKTPNFTISGILVHDSKYEARLQIFKENMVNMTKLAKQHNIPVLLLTAASNTADWPPTNETPYIPEEQKENYTNLISTANKLLNEGKFDEAFIQTQQLILQYPDYATPYFILGQIQRNHGDFTAANTNLRKARDLDIVRWRATSEMNNFVKSLTDGAKIYALDSEETLVSCSIDNLVSFEVIIDNLHPTTKGKYCLAMGIMDMLHSKNIFDITWKSPLPIIKYDEIREILHLTPDDYYEELISAAKYVLKPPFTNYKRAESLLTQAQQIRDSDWILWANLATIAFAQNFPDKGISNLEKALTLKGTKLDIHDYYNLPMLDFVLKESPSMSADVLGAFVEN